MGYIDKNLIQGEYVVYKTKKHVSVLFWPLGWAICLGYFESVVAVLVLFWLIPAIGDLLTSEYGITNRRVMVKTGFIRRRSLETFLDKIEGVSVHQSMWGRILGYGTIVFIGTGGTKNSFRRISKPLEFARKVQETLSASNQTVNLTANSSVRM